MRVDIRQTTNSIFLNDISFLTSPTGVKFIIILFAFSVTYPLALIVLTQVVLIPAFLTHFCILILLNTLPHSIITLITLCELTPTTTFTHPTVYITTIYTLYFNILSHLITLTHYTNIILIL